MKRVVNPKFSKNKKEYAAVISSIEKKGKCPFCPKNFKYHKEPILKIETGWFITKNSWPYKNTQLHFLIIGEKHKENFNELTESDFRSVKTLANWAIKKYKIKGGGLVIRFGNTDYTGATVCHLHFHLIYPKSTKDNMAKTVFFPIG